MKNKSKNITVTVFSLLLIIFIFSVSINASSIEIENINFKNADVQDVLRSVADIFDKNVVIDSTVQKNITISLHNVKFKEALELICNSSNLSYKFDGDTVFVATPSRITELYESQKMEIITLENMKIEEATNLLKTMYKDLRVSQLINNNQLIIKGLSEKVNNAKGFIEKLDKTTSDSKIIYEIINVFPQNFKMIKDSLQAIYSDITITGNSENGKILLKAKEEKIKEAIKIINRLDVKDEKTVTDEKKEDKDTETSSDNSESNNEKSTEDTKIILTQRIRLDYIPLEDATNILNNNYNNINVTSNPTFKELIIKGTKSEIEKAENFLNKLDKPRKQVMIEVRVEEISMSDAEELGIQSLADNESSNDPKILFKTDGWNIDAVEMRLPEVLDFMSRNSKSETLANPHLITLNGEQGRLLIGDRIPVKTVNQDGSESIKYIEAGITLEFEPWISENNLIQLEVSPSVSSLGEDKYEGYPVIQTREVETTLNLKNGETFAIGGLIQRDNSMGKSALPYLSEVPILGELFKRRNNDESKTELIIFITPKIIDGYENKEVESNYEYLNFEKPSSDEF